VSQPVLLGLAGVAKFLGERLVFKNLDLEVGAGEVLMVVGVNGAGKTTLLRIMAGLARPSAGQVTSLVERRDMAFVGHQTFLYHEATALENLRFWTSLQGPGLTDSVLEQALSRVGLARFAQEQAGHFSRGMAQRLNLARVLCLAPKLLFLDEPDTGLDQRSRAMLADEIVQAPGTGRAVVWVSHHLERDMPLANRVLHLHKGRAAYLGPAKDFDASALAGEPAC